MSSKRTTKYLIGIAIAAAVPLLSFFILKSASKGNSVMPGYYRPDRVDSVLRDGQWQYDTVFHRVEELTLVNQLGDTVRLNEDLKGKILVIDFIFTTCKTICPVLTRNMRVLQKSYLKKNPDWVQFISITVDPGRDTVEALRHFADRYHADHDRWWFLTGDAKAIFNYARNELGLTLQPSDGAPGMFDHSEKMVLIDSARHIRGYYDGSDITEVQKIADKIAWLTMEKVKPEKD